MRRRIVLSTLICTIWAGICFSQTKGATAGAARNSGSANSNAVTTVRPKVYVWTFQSRTVTDATLLDNISDEFETLVVQLGKYQVLQRRTLARLLKQRDDESRLLSSLSNIDQLDRETLETADAEAVFFGTVVNDIASGTVKISVTLESFDSSILWKGEVLMRPLVLQDPELRKERLKSLLGEVPSDGRLESILRVAPGDEVLPIASVAAPEANATIFGAIRPPEIAFEIGFRMEMIEAFGSSLPLDSAMRDFAQQVGLRAHTTERGPTLQAFYKQQIDSKFSDFYSLGYYLAQGQLAAAANFASQASNDAQRAAGFAAAYPLRVKPTIQLYLMRSRVDVDIEEIPDSIETLPGGSDRNIAFGLFVERVRSAIRAHK